MIECLLIHNTQITHDGKYWGVTFESKINIRQKVKVNKMRTQNKILLHLFFNITGKVPLVLTMDR